MPGNGFLMLMTTVDDKMFIWQSASNGSLSNGGGCTSNDRFRKKFSKNFDRVGLGWFPEIVRVTLLVAVMPIRQRKKV